MGQRSEIAYIEKLLDDPTLLGLESEAKKASTMVQGLLSNPIFHGVHWYNKNGLKAAAGVLQWTKNTGVLCHQLVHRGLATIHAALALHPPSDDNKQYVWGYEGRSDAFKAMAEVIADFHKDFEPFYVKGTGDLAKFDDFLRSLDVFPEEEPNRAIKALRLRMGTKRTQKDIAKEITGKASSSVFSQLERRSIWLIKEAYIRRAIRDSSPPEPLLKAIALLSMEEINEGPEQIASSVCFLTSSGAINERIGEQVIRLTVEGNELLRYMGEIAQCPKHLERSWPVRNRASDYLPENLGISVPNPEALQWILNQSFPPDVKLVLLAIAVQGRIDSRTREFSGLAFSRWDSSCKYIHKKSLLNKLQENCCSHDN